MPLITRVLSPHDHHVLLPLLSAYGEEMAPHLAGAAPAAPEVMLKLIADDPRAEIVAAFRDGEAVGFALFFDLPEIVFARRCGALDDLFVGPSARRQGIARHLIEALVGTYPVHVSQHIRKKMKMQPISLVETEEDEAPKSLDELFERLGEQTDFQMAEMYERPEDCTSISPSALSAEEELGRAQTLDKIRVFVDLSLSPLERKVFVGRHYKDPQVSFETLCIRLKTTKFAVREAYRTALEKVQAEFKK